MRLPHNVRHHPLGPAAAPNVTDPWAVVAAYYGEIESGDYHDAWQLLDSGMTTGQTYVEQNYSGTDTVVDGKIVAADISLDS